MAFKHSETAFSISELVYVGDKSSYSQVESWEWHMKPIWLNDSTFNLSWIPGDAYKLTFEWKIDLKGSEQIEILSWDYQGQYTIKDKRIYKGVTFQTQKLLLIKSEW